MVRFTGVFAAMAFSAVCLAGPASAEADYAFPDTGFSAAFPAEPKVDSHPPSNPDAPGDWIYSAQSGGGDFTVRIDQYPAGIPVPAPNQRTYELLLAGHAHQTSSRLASATPIKLSGLDAVEGTFTDFAGLMVKMDVLMVGHRLYQVSYTHAEASDVAPVGDAFLKSFKVLGR